MERSATVQPKALPALMAISTAARLSEGRAPGSPRQTGQTWVLGGAPKCVGQGQKIFVRVRSSAWTSRPMTGSKSAAGMVHQRRRLFAEARPGLVGEGEAEEGLLVERLSNQL